MDFWSTTWSAVLAGVVTFVLTTVPMGIAEAARRARRPSSPAATPPAPLDDHSLGIAVAGDNSGTINTRLEDNRSFRSSKKIKKVITTPGRTALATGAGHGGGQGDEFAYGLLALGLLVVLATLFIWAYPFLFVIMACGLGVVLGMVVAGCRQSLHVHGVWTRRATGVVTRAVAVTVGLIVTSAVMRSTVRGLMSLEAMNHAIFASPDAPATTTNPLGAFLEAGIERVVSFFRTYGWAGAEFALSLFLSVVVIALVMLSVAITSVDWSLSLRQESGEKLRKRSRRRAKAFLRRSLTGQIWGHLWVVVFCGAAVALAAGLGFDALTAIKEGMTPTLAPPGP